MPTACDIQRAFVQFEYKKNRRRKIFCVEINLKCVGDERDANSQPIHSRTEKQRRSVTCDWRSDWKHWRALSAQAQMQFTQMQSINKLSYFRCYLFAMDTEECFRYVFSLPNESQNCIQKMQHSRYLSPIQQKKSSFYCCNISILKWIHFESYFANVLQFRSTSESIVMHPDSTQSRRHRFNLDVCVCVCLR